VHLPQGKDIVIDSEGSIALVTDSSLKGILAVDLVTGDRFIVSFSNTGSGFNFEFPIGIAATDTPEYLLVIDTDSNALYQIEPESGDRVIISR